MDVHHAQCLWRDLSFRQMQVPFGPVDSIPICLTIFPFVIIRALTNRLRSKRMLFLLGILTMTASTFLLFLGTHVAIAVVARALQGVSAGLVRISDFAFLTSHVEGKNVGWAMGILSVSLGAGELQGPVVEEVMYESAGHFTVLGLICAIPEWIWSYGLCLWTNLRNRALIL